MPRLIYLQSHNREPHASSQCQRTHDTCICCKLRDARSRPCRNGGACQTARPSYQLHSSGHPTTVALPQSKIKVPTTVRSVDQSTCCWHPTENQGATVSPQTQSYDWERRRVELVMPARYDAAQKTRPPSHQHQQPRHNGGTCENSVPPTRNRNLSLRGSESLHCNTPWPTRSFPTEHHHAQHHHDPPRARLALPGCAQNNHGHARYVSRVSMNIDEKF